jgi:hypothetical protein
LDSLAIRSAEKTCCGDIVIVVLLSLLAVDLLHLGDAYHIVLAVVFGALRTGGVKEIGLLDLFTSALDEGL